MTNIGWRSISVALFSVGVSPDSDGTQPHCYVTVHGRSRLLRDQGNNLEIIIDIVTSIVPGPLIHDQVRDYDSTDSTSQTVGGGFLVVGPGGCSEDGINS